jgi:hypothetical protein
MYILYSTRYNLLYLVLVPEYDVVTDPSRVASYAMYLYVCRYLGNLLSAVRSVPWQAVSTRVLTLTLVYTW